MNTKIKYLSRVAFIICMISGFSYFIYGKIFPPIESQDPLINKIMQSTKNNNTEEIKTLKTNNNESNKVSTDNELTFTNADSYDNIQWHADRGYFSEDEQETYRNYDLPTLEAMSKNGDTHALSELGDRHIEQGDIKNAEKYYWDAAAAGSTAVLGKLAHISTEPEFSLNETREERSALRKAGTIEALAILKLSATRGDYNASIGVAKTIKSGYEILEKKPLILSDEELMIIDSRAAEIYRDLQNSRQEMGLNDFDNSSSKILYETHKNDIN